MANSQSLQIRPFSTLLCARSTFFTRSFSCTCFETTTNRAGVNGSSWSFCDIRTRKRSLLRQVSETLRRHSYCEAWESSENSTILNFAVYNQVNNDNLVINALSIQFVITRKEAKKFLDITHVLILFARVNTFMFVAFTFFINGRVIYFAYNSIPIQHIFLSTLPNLVLFYIVIPICYAVRSCSSLQDLSDLTEVRVLIALF